MSVSDTQAGGGGPGYLSWFHPAPATTSMSGLMALLQPVPDFPVFRQSRAAMFHVKHLQIYSEAGR
jgi:hypothetical protein